MAQRIESSELERLLADDSVPDATIAAFLKPARLRTLPYEPMLAINEAIVDAPSTRGIIGVSVAALNARSNRKRLAAYKARIDGGWKGLKVLAEGDSWFHYPILLRDIVDNLSDTYAVYSVAAAGDALENMVNATAQLESLTKSEAFDAMLISAGGNDIAGEALLSHLSALPAPSQSPNDYIAGTFDGALDTSRARFEGIITRLTTTFPRLNVFVHGYDWPFPQNTGLWLEPAFSARHIPEPVRSAILRQMIDRNYDMLRTLAARFNGRVHVVDCRGSIGPADQWFDELHPTNAGFARAASRFREQINQTFGISATRDALVAKVSWRPHEEQPGVRSRFRLLPAGASVTIGRSAEREIMLDDERVSRNHARLTIGQSDVGIEDLGSSNGTLVDGKRVTQARWTPGQKVRIAHYLLELEFVSAEATLVAFPPAPTARPGQVAHPVHHVEITIVEGSIADQPSRGWAVGVFQNVNPVATRGPARAIDETNGGILTAVLESKSIDARPGKITTLPTFTERGEGRSLFLAGLGAIGAFVPKALEASGENLARILVATRIFEIATVPIGLNSGLSMKDCVESFLTGLLHGIQEDDKNREFQRITLCEVDKDRCSQLTANMKALAAGDFFSSRGFAVSLVERQDKGGRSSGAPAGKTAPGAGVSAIHLEVISLAERTLDYSLLSADLGAAILRYRQPVDAKTETAISLAARTLSQFDAVFGKSLVDAYIPPTLQQSITASLGAASGHLVIQHDSASSGVPWEAAALDGRFLALDFGVSRRFYHYETAPRIDGKTRTPISRGGPLRMLMIQNPTGNLTGAEKEGLALTELFKANGCDVKVLGRADGSRAAVLAELRTGNYDILHHAGHAGFTENQPKLSGILLQDGRLTAADMENVPTVPHLIFLNACQSGRLRDGATEQSGASADAAPSPIEHASLAEGFLLHGVANFIGTNWPVNDDAALTFAMVFYKGLIAGEPLGLAMREARQTVFKGGQRDWANYVHFGDPAYVLRKPADQVPTPPAPAAAAAVAIRAGDQPDPLAGESAPRAIVAERGSERGAELPISRQQARKVANWMRTNFGGALQSAVGGTKFTVEHLLGIACQETAYFWVDLIDKLPVQTIIERCVLDASGDYPGTSRNAFPVNTATFLARYGDALTTLLIDEANKTRAIRNYGPKAWVYKGYGLFQYDLQYVATDPAFFRERQWYSFDACLAKAMGELNRKYQATGDIRTAIRAYNGAGRKAEIYADNVTQFSQWCGDVMVA